MLFLCWEHSGFGEWGMSSVFRNWLKMASGVSEPSDLETKESMQKSYCLYFSVSDLKLHIKALWYVANQQEI